MPREFFVREPRNKCTSCRRSRNIHWRDYWHGGSAALCFDCISFMGWEKEKEDIIGKTSVCTRCKDRFVPKGEWQKECTICWLKRTGKIKEDDLTTQQML